MKKLASLFFFSSFLSINLSAQLIESWIDAKKPVLFEKLYVHIDRELYAPGDKIWMKVYQVNGITHRPNANFRNIFIQLIAENGRVVRDMVLFSIGGQAYGNFKTDNLPAGMYTIRAFTRYLENFGEEVYFHKKIGISTSAQSVDLTENENKDTDKIDVSFLPEGGSLVVNAVNTLAFKAIDSKGRGIYISGKIRNGAGDTITTFNTSYLGMGKLMMMPEDDVDYYATFDQYPELKIQLPRCVKTGISLNYKEIDESLVIGLSANMKLNAHPEFYLVASHKGIVLFYKKITMSDFTQTVHLSKTLFPKGISKITLLDTTLTQFAERLIFVDDGMESNISISRNKNDFGSRDSVRLTLEAQIDPTDFINYGLSVSVVNKNYFNETGNNQTIRSFLLLDSDLKGAIEAADSYFKDDENISSAAKLDLLMMVHGWKSYIWDDVVQSESPNLNDWNDAGIILKGYVKKLLWEDPIQYGKVVLGPAGGNFLFEETQTDSAGRFEFSHLYLRDSTLVMINAKTRKGNRSTEIRLDPIFKLDSIVSLDSFRNEAFDIYAHRNFYMDNYYRRMKEVGFNPEKGSILLSEVEVIKDLIPKGATQFKIYSDPDRSYKIKDEDYSYNNIFEYLEGKVAGMVVTGNGISMRGGGLPLFLIDGFEVSDFPPGSGNMLNEIKNLRMNEIERIDILKNSMNMAMFGSKGGNGVIAIYRTSGDYTENRQRFIKGRIAERIKGFNRPARFYAPKYTLENRNDPAPDFRPTLYWNPEVIFINGRANLDFYTSDEMAQYDIFVEGITKNGKICFGTTSFSVNKK